MPYGLEEDIMHFYFKMAWQDAPHLPIFRPGTNTIPVIHIDSLCSILLSITEAFPQKNYYLIATDPQSVTLKEVVKVWHISLQIIFTVLGLVRIFFGLSSNTFF